MSELDEPDELLTPAQLAAEWQMSTSTLATWRSSGTGPPYEKIGHAVRYSRVEIWKWRNERSRP